MAEQFLVSIQLDSLDNPPPGSLALISVSYLGRVYFDVLPSQITAASTFLQDHFGEFSTYCNATALSDIGDLISLLDNGATKIFITQQQLKDVVEGNLLEDLSRLVLSIEPAVNEKDPAITVKDVQKQLENLTGNAKIDVHVRDVQDGKLLDMMQEYRKQPESYPRAYFPLADVTKESYSKAIQDGHVPIVPASTLTVDVDGYPKLAPAAMLITSLLKSDRQDGLYPTVVSNERGVCLGLVYSSDESIHKAIQSGAGVYYSRSHKGLWVKGATSGDTQELIDIRWDCDADALQFTVKQKGTGRLDALIMISIATDPFIRILPFTNRNLFRALLWTLTLGTDVARSQSFSPCKIIHCKAFQRTKASTSEDHGGGKRALRSIQQRRHRGRSGRSAVLRFGQMYRCRCGPCGC